ncbi:hypothetical protein OVA11_08300 [Caulobacter sp. SL161]|uniref:hypothetical protein n=1 Tax=Caulobacter sp. SL161 TaxID=2995156 RepID=UPI0022737E5D|nr:hypothetical protein [Caulobacter sp. SL161]MCY1647052.1 hypothetical protein [Caulobacter sp. SL161]
MFKSLPAAVAALWFFAAAAVSAAEKPDLAVYGRLPQIEGVTISPDGTKLAVIRTDGQERVLVVRKLNGELLGGVKAA